MVNMTRPIINEEAGKDGAVVVVDSGCHTENMTEMLSDTSFDEETESEAHTETRYMISILLQKHGQGIIKDEHNYLTHFERATVIDCERYINVY